MRPTHPDARPGDYMRDPAHLARYRPFTLALALLPGAGIGTRASSATLDPTPTRLAIDDALFAATLEAALAAARALAPLDESAVILTPGDHLMLPPALLERRLLQLAGFLRQAGAAEGIFVPVAFDLAAPDAMCRGLDRLRAVGRAARTVIQPIVTLTPDDAAPGRWPVLERLIRHAGGISPEIVVNEATLLDPRLPVLLQRLYGLACFEVGFVWQPEVTGPLGPAAEAALVRLSRRVPGQARSGLHTVVYTAAAAQAAEPAGSAAFDERFAGWLALQLASSWHVDGEGALAPLLDGAWLRHLAPPPGAPSFGHVLDGGFAPEAPARIGRHLLRSLARRACQTCPALVPCARTALPLLAALLPSRGEACPHMGRALFADAAAQVAADSAARAAA